MLLASRMLANVPQVDFIVYPSVIHVRQMTATQIQQQAQTISTNLQSLSPITSFQVNLRLLEPLQCCRADDESGVIRKRMEEPDLDFDVMGMEENGEIYGYIERATLAGGPCRKYSRTFHPSELIAESASLTDVFSVLHDAPRIFVLKRTKVMGIVTRGDLQKAPVRMWVFGLVTLVEMNLLFLVRARYPHDTWQNHISEARLRMAKDLFNERKKRNEAIDLADCLQICDKADLVLKIPDIKQKIKGLAKIKQYLRVSVRQEYLVTADFVDSAIESDLNHSIHNDTLRECSISTLALVCARRGASDSISLI